MKKRWPAFTLIELAVVMLLTGLVFSLGYLAWQQWGKQWREFRDFREEWAEVERWNSWMKRDLMECERLERVESGLRFIGPGPAEKYWMLTEQGWVRQNGPVETSFKTSNLEMACFHRAIPVPEALPLTDSVALSYRVGNGKYRFTLSKRYPIDQEIRTDYAN